MGLHGEQSCAPTALHGAAVAIGPALGLLFVGFFIVGSNIQWPLRVFLWMLPQRWAISSMVRTELLGANFDSAASRPRSPMPLPSPPLPRRRGGRRATGAGEQELWSRNPTLTLRPDRGHLVAGRGPPGLRRPRLQARLRRPLPRRWRAHRPDGPCVPYSVLSRGLPVPHRYARVRSCVSVHACASTAAAGHMSPDLFRRKGAAGAPPRPGRA